MSKLNPYEVDLSCFKKFIFSGKGNYISTPGSACFATKNCGRWHFYIEHRSHDEEITFKEYTNTYFSGYPLITRILVKGDNNFSPENLLGWKIWHERPKMILEEKVNLSFLVSSFQGFPKHCVQLIQDWKEGKSKSYSPDIFSSFASPYILCEYQRDEIFQKMMQEDVFVRAGIENYLQKQEESGGYFCIKNITFKFKDGLWNGKAREDVIEEVYSLGYRPNPWDFIYKQMRNIPSLSAECIVERQNALNCICRNTTKEKKYFSILRYELLYFFDILENWKEYQEKEIFPYIKSFVSGKENLPEISSLFSQSTEEHKNS